MYSNEHKSVHKSVCSAQFILVWYRTDELVKLKINIWDIRQFLLHLADIKLAKHVSALRLPCFQCSLLQLSCSILAFLSRWYSQSVTVFDVLVLCSTYSGNPTVSWHLGNFHLSEILSFLCLISWRFIVIQVSQYLFKFMRKSMNTNTNAHMHAGVCDLFIWSLLWKTIFFVSFASCKALCDKPVCQKNAL